MSAGPEPVQENELEALQAEWTALLPGDFGCSVVPVADYRAQLADGEAALVSGAHPRRVAGFSSGRLAARQALAQAGHRGAPAEVGSKDGAPIPPQGFRLSITHTDDYAVAAACRADRAGGLGLDLERFARIDPAWRRHLVRPIDRIPDTAGRLELALVFSLRESLFKALSSAGLGELFETTALEWEAATGAPRPASEAARLSSGVRRLGEHVLSFCVVEGEALNF